MPGGVTESDRFGGGGPGLYRHSTLAVEFELPGWVGLAASGLVRLAACTELDSPACNALPSLETDLESRARILSGLNMRS